MHDTAYNNATNFYKKYCQNNMKDLMIDIFKYRIVLDFGSLDVNGTLKPIFINDNKLYKYIGIDQMAGENVDLVCSTHKVPLSDNYADTIVSSSCFEHDDMFWLTFLEMCRLIKGGGYIYINAPSNGPYHPYPVDNWRFYKDSWSALAKWGNYNNYSVCLVESYIDEKLSSDGDWYDSVGIFKKTS